MKRILAFFLIGLYDHIQGQVNPCATPPAPPKTFTSGSTLVFRGDSNMVYTTALVAAPGYNWYYTGTGVSLSMAGNTATLHFSMTATSGNPVVQTHNYCVTGGSLSLPITVLPGNPCIANLHLTLADSIVSGSNYRRALERIAATFILHLATVYRPLFTRQSQNNSIIAARSKHDRSLFRQRLSTTWI